MIETDYIGHRDPAQLAAHVKRLEERRAKEYADATDFMFAGADEHAERCVHAAACEHEKCKRESCLPCSRDYDALPYPEAEPVPTNFYVGTGIGALYGLGWDPPDSVLYDEDGAGALVSWPSYATQLAGWNLTWGRSELPASLKAELRETQWLLDMAAA